MGQGAAPTRRGFSLIELVIVMLVMGIVAAFAVPRIDLAGYRANAAAQQVRGTLQTAQRTALTRQYDMIVSFDTPNNRMLVSPDSNNSGTLEAWEQGTWRPLGTPEGNRFVIPPRGFSALPLTSAVIGSTMKKLNGFPILTYHRDGSVSSDAEIYVANGARGKTQYRLVTVVRSTGRADTWRLSGSGALARWERAK